MARFRVQFCGSVANGSIDRRARIGCQSVNPLIRQSAIYTMSIKSLIPAFALDAYHLGLSWLAAVWYGHPSKKMIVIGVTGTNGKSSTCYFLAHALEASGKKTGMTSTALFKIADKEWTNDTKMTMLGRFRLQKLLRRMVSAGCKYAVVETSSQGILQHRHREIAYDACVFTNLTPEHIEAHGGFENYKQAKLELFRHTASLPQKIIGGIEIPRFAVVNADSEHAETFAGAGLSPVIRFGIRNRADVSASDIHDAMDHVSFSVGETSFRLNTSGEVMVENGLAAIATAEALGFSRQAIADALAKTPGMPGRYEAINDGQPWNVIVDYAYEPAALGRLFDHIDRFKGDGRVIHLTGSAGGGRDVGRREIIGRLSATRADVTIVTNEDPYDDDPDEIIRQVADASVAAGKKDCETLFRISDRRKAIQKAMELACPGDTVLITGKGNEPVMAVAGGRKEPWDDREEARRAVRGRGEG